jgi:PhnB protein
MPIKSLNPYLNFAGTASAAIQLYESALGAVAQNVVRYGDMPGNKQPEATKNFVMHAVLKLGDAIIMLSDVQPGQQVASGDALHVALHYTDPDEMTKAFNALSAGGKITMPLNDTFWGAKFGMLTDSYGIRWMFNCELKK